MTPDEPQEPDAPDEPDAGGPGRAAVLGALIDAHVQFVVVGDLDSFEAEGGTAAAGEAGVNGGHTSVVPLRLVVSAHPTNLASLGRVLDSFGTTLRRRPRDPSGLGRIGDPEGTLSVRAGRVVLDLLFGGPRASLYAETRSRASEVEVYGLRVPWARAQDPADSSSPAAPTGKALGRRLLSVAEHLARLVERSGTEGPVPTREPDEDGA